MINELATTAKQVGLELINLSDTFAENMQRWSDVLAQNPDSATATISAGFVAKPSPTSALEMVVDVQTPSDGSAVLRTWAIETRIGSDQTDQKEHFNNIQLTFAVDAQQAARLVANGGDITRSDIRLLLKNPASQLAQVTVSSGAGGDGAKQTHGERYDFTATELSQSPDDATRVDQTLQTVLQDLKQSLAGS